MVKLSDYRLLKMVGLLRKVLEVFSLYFVLGKEFDSATVNCL